MKKTHLEFFTLDGQSQKILFIETLNVQPGVTCDVYTFVGDTTKDLGIITILPGHKTPLQKVLSGDRTIEGYISGKGTLVITGRDGQVETFEADDSKHMHPVVTVMIGEIMQWHADPHTELQAYEICYPPYVDGRYKNVEE